MATEQQVDKIFLSALKLKPGQRDAFLEQACQNSEQRREVESLIDAYENAGSFLESPAMESFPQLADPLIGRTLGDFIIRDRLGEGGFGVVYRADQLSLQREAVVKVLHTTHRSNKEIIERFLREARLASRLEHPYTAHIYSFGAESDGMMWIAMEMVHGTPLDRLLQIQGPIPLKRFVPLLDKICEVVQTAHEYGIVHRDLKPANVMVISRAGRLLPKLLDFGISKGLDQDAANSGEPEMIDSKWMLSTAGERIDSEAVTEMIRRLEPAANRSAGSLRRTVGILGSISYMPPEQWESAADADARSDIYALGVLSYEAITGIRPFPGGSHFTFLDFYKAHKNTPVPSLGSSFPAALDEVMAKVMAKRPEDRYGTATEFARAFHEATGFSEQRASLPQLDETLRESLMAQAPRPIAEAVADFATARNAHQAREQMLEILRAAVRYIGLLALVCRSRLGSSLKGDSETVVDALRRLRGDSLTEQGWLELARELCRPFALRRDAYPIPELISLFFEQSSARPGEKSRLLDSIIEMQRTLSRNATEAQALEELSRHLPQLASFLESLSFLWNYYIVTRRGDRLEQWMGLSGFRYFQLQIADCGLGNEEMNSDNPQSTIHNPQLIDSEGQPVLSLWPLIQAAEPAPGSGEKIFFFEGKGRHGAKLVAMPSGFERQDEAVWEWFGKNFFTDEDEQRDNAEQPRTPYPGLTSFTPADADLFYGREREAETFLNRLRVEPLLTVVGASGAGKSSFIQAGILPELPAGWRTITVRPGPTPLATLEARLKKEQINITNLREKLESDRDALGVELRRVAETEGTTLLLVVDQFEELFTLCLDPVERQLYSEGLGRAARSAEDMVRVVLTLRDDFLVRAKQMPGLKERLVQGLEVLTTPEPEDLMRILIKPAQQAGYEFEDRELPREIVEEVADQAGALPLLAFTAAKLWELRDRHFKRLLRKAYEAMGGVGGALAQHAEAVMAEMMQDEQRLVREAFRQLVTGEGTRAVLTEPELIQLLGATAQAEAVVERLIAARLLVASEGEQGVERIEIVHEALLGAWPRLVKWRQEDAEGARLRDQLRSAARQWEERGHVKGLLWRDDALVEYQLWRSRYIGSLTQSEEAFGRSSLAEAVQTRRRRRLGAGFLLAVLITGLLVLLWQRNLAEQNARRAEENARKEISERERAERNAEEAKQEKARAEEQRLLAEGSASEAKRQSELAELNAKQAEQSSTLAEDNATQARQQLIELYEEQGRQELLNGNYSRALVYLNEVYQSGKGGSALRFMIAQSIQPLDAQLISLSGHTSLVAFAVFSPDGRRIVTASDDKTARVWDAKSGKELISLSGHTSNVNYATFSPDGRRLVTASLDNRARVWDTESGKLLVSMEAYTGLLSPAAFSPDGRRILLPGNDKTAKIWDVATGEQLLSLEGHTDLVNCAVFSPDGSRIATASRDKSAKIWDTASGKMLLSLDKHTSSVNSVVFSPDGKRVITTSRDNSAIVWDATEGKLLFTLSGHSQSVNSAAFSPNSSRLLTVGDDKIAKVWDGANGKLLASLQKYTGIASSAAFSPDSQRIVSASDDKTAKIWDSASGRLLGSLQGHISFVNSALFSPDGSRIVTSSWDKTARIWSAMNGRLMASLTGHTSLVSSAAFSPVGGRIVTASWDKTARVWDSDGKLLNTLAGHKGSINFANFSPDGRRIVTASEDSSANVWDAASGKLLFSLKESNSVMNYAAFSPDSRRIITAGRFSKVLVWDATDGKLLATLKEHVANVSFAVFSNDGRFILTASDDKTAKVWDTASNKLVASLEGHKARVSTAAFSPDGKQIVTASWDATAKLWDAASGKLLVTYPGHTSNVNFVVFSPDGRRIVTASEDNSAKVWEAKSGRFLASLEGHTNAVFMAIFSPDGQIIATASRDNTAKVWDAATGRLLASLEGHTSGVSSVLFSSDGQRIITASRDGSAKVWDIRLENRSPGEIAKIVKQQVPFYLDQGRLIPGQR